MSVLEPAHLLATFGVVGLFVILLVETGLLVGMVLPGDSLLVGAGLMTATSSTAVGHLPLTGVLVATAAGALLGAQLGFAIGRHLGPRLLDRPDRPRLQAVVTSSRQTLERYGVGRAVVVARFVPLVRTVLNPLAGAVGVPTWRFVRWQVLGGLVWTVGLVTVGHVLGSAIPDVDRYLLPILAVIVAGSLLPVALEARHRQSHRNETDTCPDASPDLAA